MGWTTLAAVPWGTPLSGTLWSVLPATVAILFASAVAFVVLSFVDSRGRRKDPDRPQAEPSPTASGPSTQGVADPTSRWSRH